MRFFLSEYFTFPAAIYTQNISYDNLLLLHKSNTACNGFCQSEIVKKHQGTLTHSQSQPLLLQNHGQPWVQTSQAVSEYLSVLGMWEELPSFPSITPTATHLHTTAQTLHVSHALWEFRALAIIICTTITCIRRTRRTQRLVSVFIIEFLFSKTMKYSLGIREIKSLNLD